MAQNFKQIIVLTLANAQLFRPIWSDTILQETADAITKRGADGQKYADYLKTAYPSALAQSDYVHLVGKIQLSYENDRHVVAVALQALAATRAKLKKCSDGQAFVDLMAERGLTSSAEYLAQYADRL